MFGKIKFQKDSGQATTEYILMLSVIVGIYFFVVQFLSKINIDKKIYNAMTQYFVSAYKYGHVKAKGYDEEDPEYHPRIYTGGSNNNFRIFFNPDG